MNLHWTTLWLMYTINYGISDWVFKNNLWIGLVTLNEISSLLLIKSLTYSFLSNVQKSVFGFMLQLDNYILTSRLGSCRKLCLSCGMVWRENQRRGYLKMPSRSFGCLAAAPTICYFISINSSPGYHIGFSCIDETKTPDQNAVAVIARTIIFHKTL